MSQAEGNGASRSIKKKMLIQHIVRNARVEEFLHIGQLMVSVYSQLDGFPKEADQPLYYKMLANVGDLTHKP